MKPKVRKFPLAALLVAAIGGGCSRSQPEELTRLSEQQQKPSNPATGANPSHLPYGLQEPPASNNGVNDRNISVVKRSVSLSYDCRRGQANWAAWRVKPENLGNAPRQDDFFTEKSLPLGCTRTEPGAYRGSGFDRGHLMPAADRTSSARANAETFTMANMLPQHPDLNRGVWREFEIRARDWVRAGAVVHNITGRLGHKGNIEGTALSVPRAFWKVVLIKTRASQFGQQGLDRLRVEAVLIPNEADVDKKPWSAYALSVDELESITGYDFNPELPDDVENQLEAGSISVSENVAAL